MCIFIIFTLPLKSCMIITKVGFGSHSAGMLDTQPYVGQNRAKCYIFPWPDRIYSHPGQDQGLGCPFGSRPVVGVSGCPSRGVGASPDRRGVVPQPEGGGVESASPDLGLGIPGQVAETPNWPAGLPDRQILGTGRGCPGPCWASRPTDVRVSAKIGPFVSPHPTMIRTYSGIVVSLFVEVL